MIVLSLLFARLCANDSLEHYFSYLNQLSQEIGNHREGEIEVVVDPADISRIQQIEQDRLIRKGVPPVEAAECSRVGIVNEDQYWIWLRDAVYFPKGIPGTYNRLLWKDQLKDKVPGVAVLPVLSSGHIALILNYRHASRSWALELPRGGKQSQETSEQTAARELKEETGLVASSIEFLGELATDTGVLSSLVPVFLARVSIQEESDPEDSEAIAGVLFLTKEELKQGLIQGFWECSMQGKKQRVPLRDAFLTFAILQAELRGMFSPPLQ